MTIASIALDLILWEYSARCTHYAHTGMRPAPLYPPSASWGSVKTSLLGGGMRVDQRSFWSWKASFIPYKAHRQCTQQRLPIDSCACYLARNTLQNETSFVDAFFPTPSFLSIICRSEGWRVMEICLRWFSFSPAHMVKVIFPPMERPHPQCACVPLIFVTDQHSISDPCGQIICVRTVEHARR